MNSLIEEKLATLPREPGVYLMKNDEGRVIYVGKAKNLKNRVTSYFRAQPKEAVKTRALVRHIVDFDYIIVDSETEALVLECNLIKKYQPRYNINLKDGKTYPYVRITNEAFPRVFVTREVVRDGSRYFGPYPSVYELHDTMDFLHKIFPWRSCGNGRFRKGEACLYAHIDYCNAPCIGGVDEASYRAMIEEVADFFNGRTEPLEARLQAEMEAASAALAFEEAAEKRDRLLAVRRLNDRQKAVLPGDQDRDVVAMARSDLGAVVQIFFVRSGKLLGNESYPLTGLGEASDEEVFASFMKQFYLAQERVPAEILVDRDSEELHLLAELLSERHGRRVRFRVPQRGHGRELMEMVDKNAREALAKRRLSMEDRQHRLSGALETIAGALGLSEPPRRIECYDISNIQGSDSVASMVVFVDGRAKKDHYRRFKIKTVEGPNDFASMNEVIGRRFARAKRENEKSAQGAKYDPSFAWLPDLVIIDGGIGQLGYARRAMREAGFAAIPTFGLAKEEELLIPEDGSEPIRLARDSQALYLLQRLRDESHRFAITYHRSLRGKRQLASVLDDIPGIGKKRKASLLTHFGSFSRILSASVDELAQVDGISQNLAEDIHSYLKTHENLRARLQGRNGRKDENR